ncbi:MAG: filamentous hemagglutinin N-terminal domain-containing protein [Alphaproteobacteria bacterium]|nr:filamentous hemagglutinin N-terminal domain-containing protein [Alphaproteobacteria bacterium]
MPAARAQVPTGGTVVGGQATIASGANQVTVTQSTDRGVIDWRSFSIGRDSRVDFLQPGASAVTLNRVVGPDPSVIAGQLTANGQIILVNQAGVFFANGAQVNVGSLIASTASIADTQRFMAGGLLAFDVASPQPNATVGNAGTITVREGGLVGLVGPSASNSGTINARLGRVTIGGAETFTVDLAGDGLINFQIGQPVTRQPVDSQGRSLPLASNTGTINADGGVVTMTARAAGSVIDSVVNVGGTIRAQAVSQEGGVLVLGAEGGGTLNISGTLDVSGKGVGQRGGRVIATAPGGRVNVASTARINASGDSGGGQVNIGGSSHGKGPIASTRDTSIANGARIAADATRQGDGGTVIVWADNATVFGGEITARGGPQGGNGGFIETSGRNTVSVLSGAWVDASAVAGTAGTWLLDPTDVTIDQPFASLISSVLESGTNVTVSTATPAGSDPGDITLLAGATISWTSLAVLILNADRNIIIDGSILGTNPAPTDRLVLNAAITDSTGNIFINGVIDLGGSFTSGGMLITTLGEPYTPPQYSFPLPCFGFSNCGFPPVVHWDPVPDRDVPVGTPNVPRIDFAFDRPAPTPLNLSGVVLVNQGNENFFNVDDAERQRRAARGGQ